MIPSRRTFLGTVLVAPGLLRSAKAGDAGTVGAGPVLRAAVIGHTGRGDYGHGLDGAFARRPGVELVGLADPDERGRAAAAARIGAPRAYATVTELLARERPQLVCVAMRHADQHHSLGMECLRAGAHVYFEKPFARSMAECDDLLAEAARRGLKIGVAHTMRAMPVVQRLRREVGDGRLGEVRELRAWGKQDARAGGEDLMVLGTHLFDLMRMFAGNPRWVSGEVQVEGRLITREDRRMVKDQVGWVAGDQVAARFGFNGGVQGTFTSDGRMRETVGHWGLEIRGSRGVARILCDLVPSVLLRESTGWSAQGRTDRWVPLEPPALPEPSLETAVRGPVDDWVAAVREGREAECSGVNGAWAVEMALGIHRSSLEGRRESFPLADRRHPLDAG